MGSCVTVTSVAAPARFASTSLVTGMSSQAMPFTAPSAAWHTSASRPAAWRGPIIVSHLLRTSVWSAGVVDEPPAVHVLAVAEMVVLPPAVTE